MKRGLLAALCALLISGSSWMCTTALAQSCCVLRGDVNADGKITSADIIALVNYVFKGGSAPACLDHGDPNTDGVTTSADIIYLVNYVFKGGLTPHPCPDLTPYVFIDEYGPGVTYEAFGGSFLAAVQLEADSVYAGTQGLSITIESAGYSGGAFTDSADVDLSLYNALTFWARASQSATLNVAGIGNDNTGTSKYMAEVVGPLALTTAWQQFVIPFPLPGKLAAERGLFYFAEGSDEGAYTIWIDEIVFDSLTTLPTPTAAIPSGTTTVDSGEVVSPGNGTVTFAGVGVGGTDVVLSAMPGYFTFTSSDPGVVSVGVDGVITAVGVGTATLTAELGTVPASGSITVNVNPAEPVPTVPAPTPTRHPDSVISLYSDAYTDVPVDTWSTVWDNADVADVVIDSDNAKKYTNLVFAGIEFLNPGPQIDASAMTHFHMDIWTPDPTGAPAVFKIKLVNDVFGSVSESELTFNDASTPPLVSENWVSFDIPLSAFSGLTGIDKLGQLIISGDPNTVYVDNVYFYNSGAPTEPLVSAPTPTADPGSVISLFSDAYTDVLVDTWSAGWDLADVSDFALGPDNMKKYASLVFAGIEFATSTIDASAMTHFHMDYWTPDATASPALFKIKLVDFGADGTYGGGDDVESELTFTDATSPALATGSWVSFDIPLADFTNLTTQGHLAQMIITSDPGPNTVFLDNIYFYAAAPTEPTTSAPTPSLPAADVISLFSDAYTNVPVDTWSTGWDMADVADVLIGSDNAKKYTNVVFAGIEFLSPGPEIDASTMTHFHMDIWTPDPTAAPAVFKIKLVNDVFGTLSEHELTFNDASTPALVTGNWVSFDIPLTDFTGLTGTDKLGQLIFVADPGPNTIWVDNVYFHK